MSRTYKAVQVTQPGKLEIVEREIIEPAFGQVRIRVEACGVCHSDALAVEGGFPGLTYPRVPGHEVIGKIEAIGPTSLHQQQCSRSRCRTLGVGRRPTDPRDSGK